MKIKVRSSGMDRKTTLLDEHRHVSFRLDNRHRLSGSSAEDEKAGLTISRAEIALIGRVSLQKSSASLNAKVSSGQTAALSPALASSQLKFTARNKWLPGVTVTNPTGDFVGHNAAQG